MGLGCSALPRPPPLAPLFGKDQDVRRGPTLGGAMLPDPNGSGWRVALASPLRAQVFDAHSAQLAAAGEEDASAAAAMQAHAPFTACRVSGEEGEGEDPPRLAVGCQDGTVLVFALVRGAITGPLCELRVDGAAESSTRSSPMKPPPTAEEEEEASPIAGSSRGCSSGFLAQSVTALCFGTEHQLYSGACGRCRLWDLRSGELRREFHLPGGDVRPATPGALCVVRRARLPLGSAASGAEDAAGAGDEAQLWIGLDTGHIAVFDVQSGVLARNFSCAGTEAVVSLALSDKYAFVFALSAHKRVSLWDAATYGLLQKYPAELITCGTDLSAMVAVDLPPASAAEESVPLLLLAGVDGSLCVRRIGRRADLKISCLLVCYLQDVSGDAGCPITSIDYHTATDSVLLGDASGTLSLVSPLRTRLGREEGSHVGLPPQPRTAAAEARGPSQAQAPEAALAPQPAPAAAAATAGSAEAPPGARDDEGAAASSGRGAPPPDDAASPEEELAGGVKDVDDGSVPFPVFSG